MLRDAPPVSDATAAPALPGAAALNPRGPLSWAPFITAAAVFVVPLAASIYIVVSGVWSYLERALLRRIYD